MPTSRSALFTAAWAVPAAFLAFTGVAKLVGPEGTPPEALRGLLAWAPWSTWLRALGALELVAAALLVAAPTRALGRGAAFALLGALTLVVVLNAHDERFVSDCGCLGALGRRGGPGHDVELLLLRNGALLTLLLLSGRLAEERVAPRDALRSAAVWGALLTLAALFGAEKMRGEGARRQREAVEQGRTFSGRLRRPLPELPLRDASGETRSLPAVVRPGDWLVVVSTTCPHCAALGPEVEALAAERRGAGGRVLLLVLEEGGPRADAWVQQHAFGGVERYALPQRRDGRRLGIEAVPTLLVLGPDARLEAHPEHGGFGSVVGTLEALRPWAAGAAEAAWAALAHRLVGEWATLGGPPRRGADGSWAAELRLPGEPNGRLLVRSGGAERADAVELAVALGSDGRIRALLPLALGSHAELARVRLEAALEPLSGRTPAEAREAVREQTRSGLLLPGPLRSVFALLEGLGAP